MDKIIIDNKEYDIVVANSFYKRLKGLMFAKSFDANKILLITHSLFAQTP